MNIYTCISSGFMQEKYFINQILAVTMTKLRIHLHFPDSIKDEIKQNNPWINPTSVDVWKWFLEKDILIKDENIDESHRKNLINNISYSLQWLEFSAGMLFENYERWTRSQKSSLNASIETMMILQYCVFCCSVMEGIGSHQFKINGTKKFKQNERILRNDWRDALVSKTGHNNLEKEILVKNIDQITSLRSDIHLDTASDTNHYYNFKKVEFKLIHNSLRLIIMGFKSELIPKNSTLLEEFVI